MMKTHPCKTLHLNITGTYLYTAHRLGAKQMVEGKADAGVLMTQNSTPQETTVREIMRNKEMPCVIPLA